MSGLIFDLPQLDGALCTEVDQGDMFFPDKGGSTVEAKRVCAGCPARAACLQRALDNDERFGVWGGLSERERRRIRPAVPVVRTLRCDECRTPVEQPATGRARHYCSQACRRAAFDQRRREIA